jgi:S1-C subfamily serine protease
MTPENEQPIVRNARKLLEQGRLPSADTLKSWLEQPTPEAVPLHPTLEIPLPPREIAKRASAAYVRVGWVFQCHKCSRWHSNLAGGYAIAPNAIATARHVLNPPEKMKPGTGLPIAVRNTDDVLVLSGVIGSDTAADAVIVKVEAHDLQPLPLNPDIQIGDTVFCLSEPFGQSPYFSSGIVNRFANRLINVSTDWAPGSSGSAVLDTQGNVIGHVGSITSLASSKTKDQRDHYMCLHWAIPAKNVLQLAKPDFRKP